MEALSLLEFETPPGNVTLPTVGNARKYTESEPVRVITGSAADPKPSRLQAYPTRSSDGEFLELSGAGVIPGASGSPAYDRAGNLIGIITDGVEQQTGRFKIRTAKAFRTLLAKANVKFDDEAALPADDRPIFFC